ncbi:hypothetical protein HZQ11_00600 [Elizabethkingia anophelis]|uniref:DUF304 domain-containing protein n=1 Tax=Elizabethkingia anophelis NUHP1 TaxID=1338011 RepID=A0A077EMX8_9FLAO|nr:MULTISPECIES: hypothetical protein [Elizabethkingia]AIL46920.1 hypothetical protein BD94_3145 [Elizabethkingia anophelis NUHP1]KUF38546.1 hypothetical protein AS358_11380 [Elizabethkingia anophelis]MBE9391910.1 hypothetical protein [Elizabethkingia anophelis]MBE9405350.1 hypothetical protein [Elizabethkingia anophelis]MCT3643556.1 hypothetical protein [Elizabethkingia anophelis]
MSAYKHLKNDGSGYLVKQYPSLQHVIILAWVLIGFVLIINTSYFKTGIVIFVLSLLLVILTFRGPRVYVDPYTKIISVKHGFGQNQYDLKDFEGFGIQRFMLMGFIPIGSYLYANFKDLPKIKRPAMSQSFGKKRMQEVYNELEELINNKNTQ